MASAMQELHKNHASESQAPHHQGVMGLHTQRRDQHLGHRWPNGNKQEIMKIQNLFFQNWLPLHNLDHVSKINKEQICV